MGFNPNMREIWKEFNHKSLPIEHWQGRIREELLYSWHRSRNYQIDPYQNHCDKVLNNYDLKKRIDDNITLLNASEALMQKLHQHLKTSDLVMVLADSEGCLLRITGNNRLISFLSKGNFIEGAFWNEKTVGTCAIGLCSHLKKPVSVMGFEHYLFCAGTSSCCASPIHNPEGRVIGILDLTGKIENVSKQTLSLACATSYAIEQQLLLHSIRQNLTLSDFYLRELKIGRAHV